jgi:hypothetical protein
MQECNNHKQGITHKANTNKDQGMDPVIIKINHSFGGLWLSPYQHPSSIDIDKT